MILSIYLWGLNTTFAVLYLLLTWSSKIFITKFSTKKFFQLFILLIPHVYLIFNYDISFYRQNSIFTYVLSILIVIYFILFDNILLSNTKILIFKILSYIFVFLALINLIFFNEFSDQRFSFIYERSTQLCFALVIIVFFNIVYTKRSYITLFAIILSIALAYNAATKKELFVLLVSLIFILSYRYKINLFCMLIISIPFFFILNATFLLEYLRLDKDIYEIGSRGLLWGHAFQVISTHPYGIGYGSWDLYLPEYGLSDAEFGGAHNGFLDFIGKFGIFFALIYYLLNM